MDVEKLQKTLKHVFFCNLLSFLISFIGGNVADLKDHKHSAYGVLCKIQSISVSKQTAWHIQLLSSLYLDCFPASWRR